MMETQQTHARGGWQDKEINVLFEAVREATRSGRPLRDVFADVACELNRKPNSIRNFYYARVRELPEMEARKAPFRTFSQGELHQLLRTVLIARGNGESVRACVTKMADGDRGRMLRYQNKYRSILKNRPEMLENVAEELRAEGLPCPQYVTCHRPRLEDEGRLMAAFEEAARLSRNMGDDLLPLMVERMGDLLRRVADAEARADARRVDGPEPAAPGTMRGPSKDLAITLTDLRSADLFDMEAGEDMDAVPYQKWADVRREADRLRVQVDLLKMHLEDTINNSRQRWEPLRLVLSEFLEIPHRERERELDSFVMRAEAALREVEVE